MKKNKKNDFKNMSNIELVDTNVLSKYSAWKHILRSILSMLYIIFFALLVVPTIFKICVISIASVFAITSIPLAIKNTIKFILTKRELDKRKIGKKDMERIQKEYKNFPKVIEISQEENIEPCPTFESVFPEFAVNYENKNEIKENKLKR